MKKLSILLLIVLSGCGGAKFKTSTNTQAESKEVGNVITKRKADTLSYTVLKPIYKDTTITVVNKENKSTLYLKYNEKGEQQISYNCDEIDELKNYVIDKIEESSIKTKEKESVFKDIYILYVFLGFAFLILINKLTNKL